jgi:cyclic pyranopterin monophosphate synthase
MSKEQKEKLEKEVFNHFDEAGNARMVDVSNKNDTSREAVAAGEISMSANCYRAIYAGNVSKGDVFGVARIAGIMAAKKVSDIIPLTHPLPITKVNVDFEPDDEKNTVKIIAKAGITGKTGVEMEALTAASVAALTIYDMCKAVDKNMVIGNIRLLTKTGGKSGSFIRD